ncbi:STAS domain-containing protein [Streptomyces sp. NPDC051133]|uniref:STAS domain-containing protein n=1 Tax=Streptomyces sp. NPDC051133 TaxID=3155521 RepID=UPI00341B39FD
MSEYDSHEHLSVSCGKANGWTVLEVGGAAVVHMPPEIREVIMAPLEESHRRLALDFCVASFLDSMGLGLSRSVKRTSDYQGWLRIACCSPQTLSVFRIGGLSQAYEIYATPGAAGRGAAI